MTPKAAKVLQEALTLTEEERSSLVDELLVSLHHTDPERDALWVREAKDRLRAFDTGEMMAIPAEEVFRELGNL